MKKLLLWGCTLTCLLLMSLNVYNAHSAKAIRANSQAYLQDLKEKDTADTVSIYPQPITDQLGVKGITGTLHLRVVDVLGNPQKSATIQSYEQMNVSELEQGIYFLNIQTEDHQRFTLRFVKK